MISQKERINNRGHSNGAAALTLLRESAKKRVPMAKLFIEYAKNFSAYNVPALCVKVTSTRVTYEFFDCSILYATNTAPGTLPLLTLGANSTE